jgi:hypothetical protein
MKKKRANWLFACCPESYFRRKCEKCMEYVILFWRLRGELRNSDAQEYDSKIQVEQKWFLHFRIFIMKQSGKIIHRTFTLKYNCSSFESKHTHAVANICSWVTAVKIMAVSLLWYRRQVVCAPLLHNVWTELEYQLDELAMCRVISSAHIVHY